MLSHIPQLAIATLQPPQRRLMPKLGGLPWGFPQELWMSCRECGEPLALLAQLPHQEPALPLGDASRVLHLFQCATPGCSTWSHDGGCNAALILPRERLGEGLTRPPRPSAMHGEIWITGWHEHEDAVPRQLSPAYGELEAFQALPEALRFPHGFAAELRTKAGGVPYWTGNGPMAIPALPRAPFEYLLQIDTFLVLPGPLPEPAAIGRDIDRFQDTRHVETLPAPSAARRENAPWEVHHETGASGYSVTFANFGSDGTLYVFIDREATPPRVLLFWNR